MRDNAQALPGCTDIDTRACQQGKTVTEAPGFFQMTFLFFVKGFINTKDIKFFSDCAVPLRDLI